MKKVGGLRVVGVCVVVMLAAQASYGGPEEQFKDEYPAAAKKLEDAYRQVTLTAKWTRVRPNKEGAGQDRFVEQREFFRDGGSCLQARKVAESNFADWPAGAEAYEGGNAALSFNAQRTSPGKEFLFNQYGADETFERNMILQNHAIFAAYCVDSTPLNDVLGKNLRIVSVTAAHWDGRDAIEVAGEYTDKMSKRVNRFYFAPKTWAFLGWKADWGDMGELVRYEAGDEWPPRISRIEQWNGIQSKVRITTVTKVTGLKFGPVAKEKFTLEGWGLKPPPLDLIGSSVVLLTDEVPADGKAVPCEVDPAAEKVLQQVAKVYGGIKSAELRGKVRVVAKQDLSEQTAEWNFAASFDEGRFRHEAEKRFYVGCNGTIEYAYAFNLNGHLFAHSFMTVPRSVAEANREMYPDSTLEVLDVQNPALGLLVEQDRRKSLCRGATKVEKLPDVAVGGITCSEIAIHGAEKGWVRRLRIDRETGMIREARYEISIPASEWEKAKELSIVVSYENPSVGGKMEAEKFAWHQPEGAQDLSPKWARLIGHAAPQVSLRMVDGKTVELSALKGSVVLLDFWATWCGPCRAALPHLDELYKANKDRGLQVFAVDVEEKAELVERFLKESPLAMPVSLDGDGVAYKAYGGGGIPMTVVIGKDGVVREILVGNSEPNRKRLKQLVEDGLKATAKE